MSTFEKAPAEPKTKTKSAKAAPAKPPAVPVSQPVQREVTDYVDFTGRTEAVQSVDIRPRVTGYLVEMPFQEGAEVKAGDLLFVIDRRPYKAQLDQAQGQVNLYQAQLKLARTTLARDRAVNALAPGSVSQQQLDQEQAVVDEAEARVEAFEKSMEIYRLNHEFTRVVSPIDGQISRYYLTLGNLVNQDQTLLDHGRLGRPDVRLLRDGRAHPAAHPQGGQRGEDQACPRTARRCPSSWGCRARTASRTRGRSTSSTTRSIPPRAASWCAASFRTPSRREATGCLSPGMFVRIRLPIGQPHPALLVIDRAVGSDQGLKYVYVLDAENKVQYRRVTTGRAAGRRPARDRGGAEAGRLGRRRRNACRSGRAMQVKPERVPMPTLGRAGRG